MSDDVMQSPPKSEEEQRLQRELTKLRKLVKRHSEKCRGWFGNPEDPEWETEVKRINENFGL